MAFTDVGNCEMGRFRRRIGLLGYLPDPQYPREGLLTFLEKGRKLQLPSHQQHARLNEYPRGVMNEC